MAPQHTVLLLISLFFPTGLALNCYSCIPDSSTGTCNDQIITCQSQCNSVTTTVYVGDFTKSQSMKTCGDPNSCITGSMNMGKDRVTLNSQCCNTNLCNSKNAPELPRKARNGKSCYTCENSDCSKILPCEGDENQCFTSTVEVGSEKVTQKGCLSKLFCGDSATRANASRMLGRAMGYKMDCCDRNLCNSAQNMTAFFLLYFLSLIYFPAFRLRCWNKWKLGFAQKLTCGYT